MHAIQTLQKYLYNISNVTVTTIIETLVKQRYC